MTERFEAVLGRWMDRRTFLQGVGASLLLAACRTPDADGDTGTELDITAPLKPSSQLRFNEVSRVRLPDLQVAPGYRAQVLIRWGDPVVAGAAPLDLASLTAEAQEQTFGFNCDYVAFLPMPRGGAGSERGLLCVNHEYTNPELMWSGVTPEDRLSHLTAERTAVEQAGHGHSVLEVRRAGEGWEVVADSPLNRRLSTRSTTMRVAGPAAGHRRLVTKADPTGTRVIGTLGNCAGGTTPWGTVLIAEENFQMYFGGDASAHPEPEGLAMMGVGAPIYGWHRFDPRFDLQAEPLEINRFGWVVELDPWDPASTPVKRTALGRLKHEGATACLAPDGRVVVYTGDDERFQCLYRFVSDRPADLARPEANADLLDAGTLSAARFEADGTLRWLPLTFGSGPLTPAHGFRDAGDVMIDARQAAALLGATPMDRPEDIEVHPHTGAVYAAFSNNHKREGTDAANPRAHNLHGHILELLPPSTAGGPDHAAEVFTWAPFLLAGDPADPDQRARYHPEVTPEGWLSCPDNLAFDPSGRLWIASDQGPTQSDATGSEGLFGAETEGPRRALTRRLFTAPRGAEVCGPCFTPDGATLFLAMQHPGEESSLDAPSTRWPDFDPAVPPRPAVIAIRRGDGGPIGG